jgi:hypothetical protein
MATIVTRSGKGSPLTNNEVDANFTNLNTEVATKVTGTGSSSGSNTGDQSKASLGLGNVDNTADSAKPVSTAQQTALNLKSNTDSPTFTGPITGGTGVVNLGSGQFYKDASGNMGIGTSSPTVKLQVMGDITCGGVLTTGNGVTNEGTGIEVGGNRTGSGTSLVDFHSTPGTDFEARLIRNSGANGNFDIINQGAGATTFITSGAECVRIDSGGNMGIGTSSPSAKLDISTGTTATVINSNNALNTGFVLKHASELTSLGNNFNQPLALLTNNTERMRINANGHVGIGTSSPATKLNVIGDIQLSRSTTASDASLNFGSNGNNYIFSGNSTNIMAFATNGTERVRIDANGKVGIGTSSPEASLHVTGTTILSTNAISDGSIELHQKGTGDRNSLIDFHSSGLPYANDFSARILRAPGLNGDLEFGNNGTGATRFISNGVEKVRIDSSGNLLVGRTSAYGDGTLGTPFFQVNGVVGSKAAAGFIANTTGSINMIGFINPNGTVGTILVNGSTTSYNTSSDYRLKNTVAPMTGALDKLALLKPVTYKWNVDGSDGQGFIAHELAKVEPGCVTGEKDAVDKDGKPQYQGIDTSFLIATLAAAIQELKAIVDEQAVKIAALEAK